MTRLPLPFLLLLALIGAACDRPTTEEELRGHEVRAPAPLDARVLAALPEGATEEQAREGAELYARTCVVCHGPTGEGTQLAPPLLGAAWSRIEAQPGPLAELIRSGIPEPGEYPVPMPARGGGEFSEEQIQAVTTYVLALHRSGPAPPP